MQESTSRFDQPWVRYLMFGAINLLIYVFVNIGLRAAEIAGPANDEFQSGDEGYPKQNFNVQTNLGYFAFSTMCFGMVRWDFWKLYLPIIVMGAKSNIQGIASMLKHGTNNAGYTGEFDVGMILPLTASFLWTIIFSAVVIISWYHVHKDKLFVREYVISSWTPYPSDWFTYGGLVVMGLFDFFNWLNIGFEWINPSWENKYAILGYLIFGIAIIAGVVPGVFLYRLYSNNQLQNVDIKLYNSLLRDIIELIFGSIICIIVFAIGVLADNGYSHATVMHISIPLMMANIMAFYRDMFNMFKRGASPVKIVPYAPPATIAV